MQWRCGDLWQRSNNERDRGAQSSTLKFKNGKNCKINLLWRFTELFREPGLPHAGPDCVCAVLYYCVVSLKCCCWWWWVAPEPCGRASERKPVCCSSPFLRLQVKGMSALPGVIGVLCTGCDRSHLPCLGGSSSYSYSLCRRRRFFSTLFTYPH